MPGYPVAVEDQGKAIALVVNELLTCYWNI
jgi:hypothetical protein